MIINIEDKSAFILYLPGLFLNGRKEKVERQRMNEPAIQKVWNYKKTDDLEGNHVQTIITLFRYQLQCVKTSVTVCLDIKLQCV